MQVVLFTHVRSLIEHCSALADGVGVTLEVRSPDSGGWQNAVLILVGEDVTHAPATPESRVCWWEPKELGMTCGGRRLGWEWTTWWCCPPVPSGCRNA